MASFLRGKVYARENLLPAFRLKANDQVVLFVSSVPRQKVAWTL